MQWEQFVQRGCLDQFVSVEIELPRAWIYVGEMSARYSPVIMPVKVKKKEKTRFMATIVRRALPSEIWAPSLTT